jgi:hypothetical protein
VAGLKLADCCFATVLSSSASTSRGWSSVSYALLSVLLLKDATEVHCCSQMYASHLLSCALASSTQKWHSKAVGLVKVGHVETVDVDSLATH